MSNQKLPFKKTSLYYIFRFFLMVSIFLLLSFSTNLACKRISGSYEQLSLIKKEVLLLSFPQNTLIKDQSYMHRYNEIDFWTIYSIPNSTHYKKPSILSYYNHSFKENGWTFLKKEKTSHSYSKKIIDKYIWTNNNYILELQIYPKVSGSKIFDNFDYENDDLIYSITISWRPN